MWSISTSWGVLTPVGRRSQELMMIAGPLMSILMLVLGVLTMARGANRWTAWAIIGTSVLMFALWRHAAGRKREHERALIAARSRAESLELELRRQRDVVDSFADGLNVAIFLTDAKGNILYCNRAALRMFGFDSAVGRSILAVSLSSDLEKLVVSAAEDSMAKEAEITFSYPEDRVGLARTWPEAPEFNRVFLSVYDVTQLRKLERVRQDFVANVSHELRTPMTSIRAMAETLLEPDENDEALRTKYLGRIVREVDRLTLIADDLLVLSRSESQPNTKEICDLVEICRNVASQLEQKSNAKHLKIVLETPEKLLLLADPEQLTQVLFNLVDNAIRYSTEGEIRVTATSSEGFAQIVVEDKGIGISVEHQPRVFERFYRVDKARSRESGGTGLGLSIVRHIVEAHGGSIHLESALNHGSKFTVRLPDSS